MAISQIPAPPLKAQKPLARTILLFSLAVLVLTSAAIAVYFASFTGFSIWDDEGYVMIGLQSFLQCKVLYDHVYSQYVPFYYLVEAGLYTALHLQVTHDAVRLVVGLVWLLTAILCAWAARRLTRSWILTAIAFTGALKTLEFFTLSPGHPEEICIALLAGILVCACYLGERRTAGLSILLGSLISALTFTKVNIGCFAALAIALAFLKADSGDRKHRALFAALSLAGLSLPVIILYPLVQTYWAQRAIGLLVLSLGVALLAAWHAETERFVTPSFWIACALAGGIAAVMIVTPFLARGTTLYGMLYMTVLQHKDTARSWYIELPVQSEWPALLSLALAAAWVRAPASGEARAAILVASNTIKIVVSLACFFSIRIADWPTMYNFTTPFAWLILVPGSGYGSQKIPFARVALCLLSVFTALYPLPVAGAQVPFAVVLMVPTVCVFLDDARAMLVRMVPLDWVKEMAKVGAVVVLAAANAMFLFWAVQHYRNLKPLSLAGADRIRLGAAQAADYRWITSTLKDSCDSNFSMPGIYSLYFWTGTPPPTELLAGNWLGLLDQDQQQQVVRDLSSYRRLCVVYSPRLVRFWRRGQKLSASPLARYIQADFSPAAQRNGYIILVRNDPSLR